MMPNLDESEDQQELENILDNDLTHLSSNDKNSKIVSDDEIQGKAKQWRIG